MATGTAGAGLDPNHLAERLEEGAILLCREKPGEFRHRQLVADWLWAAGHKVTEIAK